MRMARAFIASVPLAIVLVAALVVPLAVIPGTFGFDRWPSSHGEQVTERQVRLAPPKVDVVPVRPRRAVPERHPVIVAARPRPTRVAPTVVAVASPPAPRRDPRQAPQQQAPESPRPQPRQPEPQQTQQQPQPEPSKSPSGLLANGDAPVAREAPHQSPAPQHTPPPEPQPAPAPVQQPTPAPVERVVPSEPCHGNGHAFGHGNGHGGGPQGDGDSQQ